MTKYERVRKYWGFFVGGCGLTADLITILGAIGAGVILPSVTNNNIVKPAFESIALFTVLLALYSLTLITWFLFRWIRSKQATKSFGFDEIKSIGKDIGFYTSYANYIWVLVPYLGQVMLISLASVRTIFWFAVFLSFAPVSFWLYLVSANIGVVASLGALLSFLLSQYATFFALVLDKFFESYAL